MSSELCKTCAHHKVCMKDKNTIGDVFISGHPLFVDNHKLFEQFKEHEKAGFPCDDYMKIADDTISRQEVIDALMEDFKRIPTNAIRAKTVIEQLASAQPDIIACGDCEYWICHDRWCGFWNHGVKPLDFCSRAERKNNV